MKQLPIDLSARTSILPLLWCPSPPFSASVPEPMDLPKRVIVKVRVEQRLAEHAAVLKLKGWAQMQNRTALPTVVAVGSPLPPVVPCGVGSPLWLRSAAPPSMAIAGWASGVRLLRVWTLGCDTVPTCPELQSQ